MRLGFAHGTHFMQHGRYATAGNLPGGLGTGEATTDDVDRGDLSYRRLGHRGLGHGAYLRQDAPNRKDFNAFARRHADNGLERIG